MCYMRAMWRAAPPVPSLARMDSVRKEKQLR